MPLCEYCQTILKIDPSDRFEEEPEPKPYGRQTAYVHTSSTLLSSVATNCYFCSQFYETLSENQRDVLKDSKSAEIKCNMFWSGREEGYSKLHFALNEDFYDCDEEVIYGYELLPITGQSIVS